MFASPAIAGRRGSTLSRLDRGAELTGIPRPLRARGAAVLTTAAPSPSCSGSDSDSTPPQPRPTNPSPTPDRSAREPGRAKRRSRSTTSRTARMHSTFRSSGPSLDQTKLAVRAPPEHEVTQPRSPPQICLSNERWQHENPDAAPERRLCEHSIAGAEQPAHTVAFDQRTVSRGTSTNRGRAMTRSLPALAGPAVPVRT